jgi:hypothetical protein
MGMIGVDKIGEIRRAYFEQDRSIKEIVRTLSTSRATVRKVIRGHKTEPVAPPSITTPDALRHRWSLDRGLRDVSNPRHAEGLLRNLHSRGRMWRRFAGGT